MARLKKNLVLALGLGVAVYLVLALVSDLGGLEVALAGFDYLLIPAILGLVAVSYMVRFMRWVYYLRLLKVQMPVGINVAIFAAGLSMTISPGKLGEVLKSIFIKDVTGVAVARTAPAVVAERVTDGTGMIAWGLLGALAFSFGPEVLLLFLTLMVTGIAILRSERISFLAEKVLLKVPFLRRLAPHLRDFQGASNQLLAVRPLIVGTTLSFCSWGLEILGVYLCVTGIGAGTPFLVAVFIFVVSSLVGASTMLPGGIGAAEAGMAGMFGAVAGLSTGLSVALTLVIRLATLWFATLIGVVGLLLMRRLVGQYPKAAGAEVEREP